MKNKYFIVRSAMITLSFMLLGASILILTSALLIPRFKELNLQEVDSRTKSYQSSDYLKEKIEKPTPGPTNLPAMIENRESPKNSESPELSKMQSSINDNLTNNSLVDSTVKSTPQVSSDDVTDNVADAVKQAKINMQSSEPENQKAAEEKSTPPSEPENQKATEVKSTPRHDMISLLVIGKGLYQVGEITPKTKLQEAIDKIIPIIKALPSDYVIVEGHADKWIPNAASSPYDIPQVNHRISLERAKVIAAILEQKGVEHNRIIVRGLGDTVPLASNLTREGRAENRRVEIKLSSARE